MEQEKTDCGVHRKFGYKQIEWQIINYFPATCKQTWEIYSPEFIVFGYPSTKWRLFLKTTRGDNTGNCFTSIYIERLDPDIFPGSVRMYWKLWYACGKKPVKICEKQCVFERYGSVPSLIKNVKRLEKRLQLVSSDKLLIGGLFLVCSTEDNVMFEKPHDSGLKYLSQDLAVLYKIHTYSDFTVTVDGISLPCHKAIISARSKLLQDAIDIHGDEVEFDFDKFDSTEKIFSYLYSGNLNHILRTPSIAIEETIHYLDVNKLKTCYLRDAETLRTKIETRDLNFKWIVRDIKSRKDDFIVSKQFGIGFFNTDFQLRLYLYGTGGKSEHMSIFLETVEGSLPEELFIIFDIIDLFGYSIHKKTMRWSANEDGRLGIEDFVSRDILDDNLYIGNDSLYILCTLRIPTGWSHKSVVNSRICSFNKIKSEDHYSLLSAEIASLLDTGKHSDLTVICGRERFKVHKCILSARSSTFSNMIKALGGKNVILIPDVEHNILRIVLYYIYSGVLKNYDISDILKIYAAALKFVLLDLTYKCSKVVRENLQPHNVLEALFLANASKDLNLKYSAFKFIARNVREIQLQDKWNMLTKEKVFLHEELKKYIKHNVQHTV